MNKEAVFEKDIANKMITVTRAFEAPIELVWRAWTEADILDEWWAPKPYRAETKSMDFKEGGVWLYSMVGPEGDRNFCKVNFKTIEPQKNYSVSTGFCDENGKMLTDFPMMYWHVAFTESNGNTTANIRITFDNAADLEKYLGLGFQEGFTMALTNLDEYFAHNKD